MATLKLESPWEEVKEKLKEVEPRLNDDILDMQPGDEDALLKRVAETMDKSIEDTRMWIESVSSNKGIAS